MRARTRRSAGDASSRTWPSASSEWRSRSPSSVCRGEPASAAAELGRHRLDGAAVPDEAPRRLEQWNQRDQVDGVDHRADGPRGLERGAHVGDHVPGRAAGLTHGGPCLAGLAEGAPDRGGSVEGERGERPLPTHRRTGVAGEEALDLGPLDPVTAGD